MPPLRNIYVAVLKPYYDHDVVCYKYRGHVALAWAPGNTLEFLDRKVKATFPEAGVLELYKVCVCSVLYPISHEII
jgi:hypothetical protein